MRVLIVHRDQEGAVDVARSVSHDVTVLRERGHQVALTSGPGGTSLAVDATLELSWPEALSTWTELPARGWSRLLAPLTGVRRRLQRFVADYRPDVIHLHCAGGPLPELHAWPGPRSVPVILSVHDFTPICPAGTLFSGAAVCERCLHGDFSPALIRRCVDRDLLRSGAATLAAWRLARQDSYRDGHDLLIVPSRCVRDLLIKGELDVPRLAVLPPGLPDPGPARPAPTAPDAPMLYHGPLIEQRGLGTLLEAYAMLGPDRPPLRLVGDGPLRDHLAALGERLDLDQLSFHPQPDAAGLAAELDACRFTLVPSVGHDAFPLGVLDSLAHGRPVIATRRGALPELVDHEVGRLVEPRDGSSLAAAMDALARDHVLSAHLSLKARARFEERHTLSDHGARLESLYAAVIAGRVDELVQERAALLSHQG